MRKEDDCPLEKCRPVSGIVIPIGFALGMKTLPGFLPGISSKDDEISKVDYHFHVGEIALGSHFFVNYWEIVSIVGGKGSDGLGPRRDGAPPPRDAGPRERRPRSVLFIASGHWIVFMFHNNALAG